MVEPGMTLTGKKKYTNFYMYNGKNVTVQESGVFYDDNLLINAFDIVQIFVLENTLFCVTDSPAVIIYNFVHNIIVKVVEIDIPSIYKAVLIQDKLYLITTKNKLYESSLHTLQFCESNYGKFEDKFNMVGCSYHTERYLTSFDEFTVKFVLYDEQTLYLVDLYNRVYAFISRLVLIYHHYLDIVDIQMYNGFMHIIDPREDYCVVKCNKVVHEVSLKSPEKIVNNTFVACKDYIYNAAVDTKMLHKKTFVDMYFYQDQFFGRQKEDKNMQNKQIDVPEQKCGQKQ